MRPRAQRATTTLKVVKETFPAATLTREQRAAEGSGMEGVLRAHADAQLTLHSALPPPAGAGAEAAAGSGRGSGGGVRRARAEGAFECSTCNRRFPSFQALGGHRTGHTRLQARHALQQRQHGPEPAEARAHECAVCGLEFPMGQALGGHIRRHRDEAPAPAPAPAERRVERLEMLDLNYPPLEDRGGDQGVECPESEPRLLNLLV